ncbi:MAG: hypothetical protein O7F11_04155 [Acidobacteria bacterium]|nr:hypothetical protein [Acidobacteriota bacterium]
MSGCNRRVFLGRVGSGMLASAVGLSVGQELGLHGLIFAGEVGRLDFGDLEPLVSMMQETPGDALMPKLKTELDRGTELRTLITAAALANARTFGGEDYTGYHCFFAMVPALAMSERLSGCRAALPVLKVLHRNARRTQAHGGRRNEVLRPVVPDGSFDGNARSHLLAAGRDGQFDGAEATLASVSSRGPEATFAALQPLVRDNIDVHQVVLAYRSWDMMQLTGPDNGQVLLRQVLRQCINRDESRRRQGRKAPAIRTLLPELMDAHGLNGKIEATKKLSPTEFEELAQFIFAADRDEAARAVAAQLASGVPAADMGEALSLAAVRLLLHDPGRSRGSEGKPKGSVHGASVGLHAADTANAWRGIAAATDSPNANASLVTAAWHAAGQSSGMDRSQPHHASARDFASSVPPEKLLGALGETLRDGDQKQSCALAERYGELGRDPEALIAVLIEPALEHDGALHHEKYFHTATLEYARSRPESRWDHLVALTRVMASGYGFEAEGLAAAKSALAV